MEDARHFELQTSLLNSCDKDAALLFIELLAGSCNVKINVNDHSFKIMTAENHHASQNPSSKSLLIILCLLHTLEPSWPKPAKSLETLFRNLHSSSI